ncbi:MAG: 16S rRNA (guanine(527)-N(7))-methyltransferase RsmG, partial [Bacteroidota bacterium]
SWSKPLLKIKTKNEFTPGLISLKGGDLAAEIQESGTRPRVMEISAIFPEEFFKEKFLLTVTR